MHQNPHAALSSTCQNLFFLKNMNCFFCNSKDFYRHLVLFTGKAEASGSMHVTLCDYIMPWDSLSNTQKKGLSQRYQMGCECKVRRSQRFFGASAAAPWRDGT